MSARRTCKCILHTDTSTALFSRREHRGDAGLYLAFSLPLFCSWRLWPSSFSAAPAAACWAAIQRSPKEGLLAQPFGSSRVEASNMPFLLCLGALDLVQYLLLLGALLHLAARRKRMGIVMRTDTRDTRKER